MRQVIENGSDFNQNHLFILLLHLTPEQITDDMRYFLKVLLQWVKVSDKEFGIFLDGLVDKKMFEAY